MGAIPWVWFDTSTALDPGWYEMGLEIWRVLHYDQRLNNDTGHPESGSRLTYQGSKKPRLIWHLR